MEEQIVKFPWKNDKCPVCGSSVRLLDEATKQLLNEGQLQANYGKNSKPYMKGQVDVTALYDPLAAPTLVGPQGYVMVKAVETYYDTCECGVKYATYSNIIDVPLPQAGMPSPMKNN